MVERGYPRGLTITYQETIEQQLGSPNTVLDVRFPDANKFIASMKDHIFQHLTESMTIAKTHEDRMEVADTITMEWKQITQDYDNRDDTSLSLKAIYQNR